MRKFLACIVCNLLFFAWVSISAVYAENGIEFPDASGGQINEAVSKSTNIRILPSSPAYFVIIIKESINRFFQPSASRRAEFDFVLASKRLKESYLLADLNNFEDANESLDNYGKRMNKLTLQISKAKAQNQSMEPIIDEMAIGFNYHEILFYAISKKYEEKGSSIDSFDNASMDFIDAIDDIDAFRPGFKNRYKSAKNYTILKAKLEQSQTTPITQPSPETSASASPKRIIY